LYYYEILVSNDRKDAWDGVGRLMGIFGDFSTANRVVRNNETDIFEYTYKYAVISEYHFGMYPRPIETKVYEYNFNDDGYDLIGVKDWETKKVVQRMCKWCESENLHTIPLDIYWEDSGYELFIYDNGDLDLWKVDDNGYLDLGNGATFKINYCPMCGRKLK